MNNDIQMILRIEDNNAFERALVDFVFKPGLNRRYADEIGSFPPLVEAVMEIDIFDLIISTSGMWKYLVEHGNSVEALRRVCRNIGATTAVEYLNSVTSHFSDGVIPKDEDERMDRCGELELELRKIDREHSGAISDTVDRLREHIKTNHVEFQRQVSEFWAKYS
jgi:hypothetical protein